MTPAFIQIAIAIAGVVFSAGGAMFLVKQMRRDLNGIGAKARLIEDKAADRYIALSFAILLSAPEGKRTAIAQILLNAALRR
ncbi:MAG: hypothetical protein ABSE45_15085 [Candidatus Acidiferrales bacterium]|jgi:hypothetical protein